MRHDAILNSFDQFTHLAHDSVIPDAQSMSDNDGDRKRQRPEKPAPEDVLKLARAFLRRENKQSAKLTEDRKFRDHFGCGAHVVLTLWSLLLTDDLTPMGGMKHHLLWTLMVLNLCHKEQQLCDLAGGIDKKTLCKWVWGNESQHGFVEAMSDLESLVVCSPVDCSLQLG